MFSVGHIVSIHNVIVAEKGAMWSGKSRQTPSQERIIMSYLLN
jgi:hypothetical protein